MCIQIFLRSRVKLEKFGPRMSLVAVQFCGGNISLISTGFN